MKVSNGPAKKESNKKKLLTNFDISQDYIQKHGSPNNRTIRSPIANKIWCPCNRPDSFVRLKQNQNRLSHGNMYSNQDTIVSSSIINRLIFCILRGQNMLRDLSRSFSDCRTCFVFHIFIFCNVHQAVLLYRPKFLTHNIASKYSINPGISWIL